ncbi:MAG: hypothetical protein KKD12_02290 [Proteobacteria bacterium]|nr:hypothetical protein [Pseudomonadota bacterium]
MADGTGDSYIMGDLGVGTQTPLTRLHAYVSDTSNTSVTNLLTLDHVTSVSTNGSAGIGSGILLRAEDTLNQIENVAQIQGILTTATSGSEASALAFLTRTGGGSLTEHVRIDGSGQVGIGTTSPGTAKLNVSGLIFGSNGLTISAGTVSLPAGEINTAEIASGAIINIKIAPNAINTTQIIDGTILAGDISSGAITNVKIAPNAINTTQIIDGTILAGDIAASAINTTHILDGTVANLDLANSSLTVTAGTGLTGGGAVALGGSTTLNVNTTYLSNYYIDEGQSAGGQLTGTYPDPNLASSVAGVGLTGADGSPLAISPGWGLATDSGTDTINVSSSIAGAGISYASGILATVGGWGISIDSTTDTINLSSSAAGTGLGFSSGVLSVNTASGLTTSGDDVILASTTAGRGLTYTTGVLDIGQGTGLIVNADDIELNTTYLSNYYIDESQVAGGDLGGTTWLPCCNTSGIHHGRNRRRPCL